MSAPVAPSGSPRRNTAAVPALSRVVQMLWEKLRMKATPVAEKQAKIAKFLDMMKGKVRSCVRRE